MAEEQVKRRPGNPNWVKKSTADTVKNTATPVEVVPTEKKISDEEVWLRTFSSILGTYNTMGVGVIRSAAQNADTALLEYKDRFK